MRVTVVGCGDAFGTGGRSHTCFKIDSEERTILVDFGASAILGWNRLGFDLGSVDAVMLSHLHGDHFGGLPFLLLDRQFNVKRARALTIAGPPGTRSRLLSLMETMFPGTSTLKWKFALNIEEVAVAQSIELGCFSARTCGVVHESGAPSTGVRIEDSKSSFAYSGDTEWTDSLIGLSRSADLFMVECYSGARPVKGHMDLGKLLEKRHLLSASQVMVTHLGPSAYSRRDEILEAGLLVAEDGLSMTL